jgi:hypothetical protein
MNINEIIQNEFFGDKQFLKSAVLLTIAVFLISAPAPDSSIIEELTSNLISITKNPALEP